MNKKLILPAIGIAILLFVFISRNEKRAVQEQMGPAPRLAPSELVQTPSPAPSTQSTPLPLPSPLEKQIENVKSVSELMPSLESMKEEIAKNPHAAPESFIRFAAALGQAMERVFSHPGLAQAHFNELRECVLSDKPAVPNNARALCLTQAKRLAEKNESFQSQYQELRNKASDSVQKLEL